METFAGDRSDASGARAADREIRSGWPTVTRRLAEELAAMFWPAPCLHCQAVEPPLDRTLGLCPRCAARLATPPAVRCDLCGRSLPGCRTEPRPRCRACTSRRTAHRRLYVGWAYLEPATSVLRAFKFERLGFLGRELAALLAARLPLDRDAADVVVPVPLHWRRRLGRGYNQAEEIARPLARRLGLPMRRLLSRPRRTAAQARLPRRDRAANLRGAFRAGRRTAGLRILLVDDVLTTGATVAEAATTLRAAGARSVAVLVAARTPGPGEPT